MWELRIIWAFSKGYILKDKFIKFNQIDKELFQW